MPDEPDLEQDLAEIETDPTVHVTVETVGLKAALSSVLPHASKVKTGDDQAENRLRFILTADELYVVASNSSAASTALARIAIVDDSRDRGITVKTAPNVFDLQVRQAKAFNAQYKTSKKNANEDQLTELTLDYENRLTEWADVGGLFSAGEVSRYPMLDTASQFPDVAGITARALAEANARPDIPSELVADGRLMAQFKAASVAYGAKCKFDQIGGEGVPGVLVTCGPSFLGTVESRTGDDDSRRMYDRIRQDWLKRLPASARKLRTA